MGQTSRQARRQHPPPPTQVPLSRSKIRSVAKIQAMRLRPSGARTALAAATGTTQQPNCQVYNRLQRINRLAPPRFWVMR